MFQKGNTLSKGRLPGARGKATKAIRETIIEVFEGIGGKIAFIEWAKHKDNRGQFYKMYKDLAAREIEISSPDDGPIMIAISDNPGKLLAEMRKKKEQDEHKP